MKLTKRLPKGPRVLIIIPRGQEKRLRGTCFRGKHIQKAGNFSRWESGNIMLQDPLIMSPFLKELAELWGKEEFDTFSLEIDHTEFIGWSSTDELDKYSTDDLEKMPEDEDNNSRQKKKRWTAMRVKPSSKKITAPRTKSLTIICEFKKENEDPVAIIHSIYPGKDIGELKGDITKQEGVAFFDWEHEGAT